MTTITPIHTGSVTVNGAQLAYELAGTGTPLVLLHAGIADRRMWDEQIGAFAQHYQVIRYDKRGYGNSTRGAGTVTDVQDLNGLLEALSIQQAILMGCSQGGATVLDFSLDQPDKVRALILVSAVPSGYNFSGEVPARIPPFVAAYQQRELATAAELATQLWYDGPHRRPDQMNATQRAWVRAMMQDVVATGALTLGPPPSATTHPAVEHLAAVQAPTLVIVGDQDDPSLLRAGDLLAAGIPGAEKVIIPGTAHLLNLEKPAAFNQIVLDFLQRREK